MNDMENKDLTPQQPDAPAQAPDAPAAEAAAAPAGPIAEPVSQPAAEPAPAEPAAGPVAEAAAPEPQPIPGPAWEKPTPQLTLEPDPEVPAIEFTTEPPRAPEPPAPPQEPHQAEPQPPEPQPPEPQPTVQNQYVYNFNTQPAPGQAPNQGQPYAQPYAGYQPPNYTAQSYRPQPPKQPMYTTPPIGYQQKSRLAAGLLAFIFGVFGVHNFYMGFNSRGTVQLLLALVGGVLTCGVATVAAAVWAFIEAVMILSSTGPRFDGNGVIMKD